MLLCAHAQNLTAPPLSSFSTQFCAAGRTGLGRVRPCTRTGRAKLCWECLDVFSASIVGKNPPDVQTSSRQSLLVHVAKSTEYHEYHAHFYCEHDNSPDQHPTCRSGPLPYKRTFLSQKMVPHQSSICPPWPSNSAYHRTHARRGLSIMHIRVEDEMYGKSEEAMTL